MIQTKQKLLTVGILFLLVLMIVSVNGFHKAKHVVSRDIETVGELEHTMLGGVVGRMPDNSAKILFESLLGVKLSGYQSYNDVYETISALRQDEIQAAWFPDVTVRYLLSIEAGLKEVIPKLQTERQLEFGMALKADHMTLKDELNEALKSLVDQGILANLQETYIEQATIAERFTQDDLETNGYEKKLTVGITGAVWPIELMDLEQKPYGFSVALMNEIGKLMHRKIEFVTLQNDTAFSSLMGGKVDLLFCYGTSQSTLTDAKNYIMTNGYYTMNEYSYLVLE